MPKGEVDTPSIAYELMEPYWQLVDDLNGGTRSMREAGTRWLPKEDREDFMAYSARLARSFLFEAYTDALDNIVAKPFSKPVTTDPDGLPEPLRPMLDDADMAGRDITQFARDFFWSAVNYGQSHVLVEMPRVEGTLTLAQQIAQNVRPYFVHIPPPNLLAWEYKRIAGHPALVEIRWRETAKEKQGEYGEEEVKRVRVMRAAPRDPVTGENIESADGGYKPGTWELWELRKGKEGEGERWVMMEEGTHAFRGPIPLVTCYTRRKGRMIARPAMEKLAWLNIAHWQSSSDQRNFVRYARVATWFMKGVSEDEKLIPFVASALNVVKATSPEADMKVVEHSGDALGAGEEDIRRIEERMESLAAQPLQQRPGDITATGQSIDTAQSHALIHSWVRTEENALVEMFERAAEWLVAGGVSDAVIAEDWRIDIFNEFTLALRGGEDADRLLKSCQAGKLSDETYLREIQRRGLISDTVDIDEEMRRLEEAGPALAFVTNEDGSEEGEDFGGDDEDEE